VILTATLSILVVVVYSC